MGMTAETKKMWTDALRSGKYRQGTGMLCNNDSYCCLGVLAEEMGELVHTPYTHKAIPFENDRGPDVQPFNLPVSMRADLGLTDLVYELVEMNDGGMPFTEIADWIDANVPTVEDV